MSTIGVFSLFARPAGPEPCHLPIRGGAPSVDYHVHIGDGISVEQAIAIAAQRGMKFGLLQHAGSKGHGYAVSDDTELAAWVQSLEGKPVFKGIEAEGTDWPSAFSKAALAKLDYIQSDPLSFHDESGTVMQIWKPEFRTDDPQRFMERYVAYHLLLITDFPIDILVMPTFLPDALQADYDRLWTSQRVRRILDALVKFNVALEIDSRFRVPRFRVLQMAKAAGVKFAFGSNYQSLDRLGDIGYCTETYKKLRIPPEQFFWPKSEQS